MKTLLVYPEFPISYWGFQHAMPIVGKRASLPPLGLVTLAALLPKSWPLQLVDLNVTELTDESIPWADVVMISGMRVQAASMHDVIARARSLGRRTVVGGPAPTTAPSEFADADLIFVGEAEGRIDQLVAALEAAPGTQRLLRPRDERPSIVDRPVPRFELLDLDAYTSVSIQYSRGCPFSCEFCDVIEIFGRVPRLKSAAQIVEELETLYQLGFRRPVFFVDDNFIGNRKAVQALLPELKRWQEKRGYPFEFFTEASVNLAKDERLLAAMVEAGFCSVFVGIETPSVEALRDTGKMQNLALDLTEAVNRLTRAGLEVMGGFIVGFDSDGPHSFELQRRFIEASPIPLAMVGLLMALPGTALSRRLESEGRLRVQATGDQFGRTNFAPVMDEAELLQGYRKLMADLYAPAAYYARCRRFVENAKATPGNKRFAWHYLATLARAMVVIGLLRPGSRRHFWRLFFKAALTARHQFPWTIAHAAMGEHMIRYTKEVVLPRIDLALAALAEERASQERASQERASQERVRAAKPARARVAKASGRRRPLGQATSDLLPHL